ncbi:hypothetical protein SAMN04488112_10744 [Melghirimyces thermohalophilus]|uniref:Uncharacterized protein n=1 Tax=Melghirimyces thermohalophilus TaxID=1236220 RepID=A0A1G6L4M9_9BACL|nr:hypothetical protein SAMN04488112_10744 [Melghirimyces thermohalophilus]
MSLFICEVCGEQDVSPDQEAAGDARSLEILHICESCMEDRRQPSVNTT